MSELRNITSAVSEWANSLPRGLWIVTGLYLLVNLILAVLAVPGASLAQGGDSGSYWNPALALLKHGGFVQLDNPAEPDFYRTPLYPLMIAGLIWLFGESPGAVVVVQLCLLFGTGLIFRDTVRNWLPGWENFGMGLIVLNPNLLGTAHLIQSETLYLFFMAIGFWALLRIVREDFRWHNSLTIGLSLAAACLAKPTSQFLVVVIPIALPLIALVAGARSEWVRLLVQGATAAVVALAIMAPWASKLASNGNGYALSAHEIRYRYLWDQVMMLEANLHGISYHAAAGRIIAPGSYHANVIAAQGERWATLSKTERYAVLEQHGYGAIFSYPPEVIFRVMARSVAQFMVSGGAGNLHNLLGTDTGRLNQVWFKTSQQDVGGMLKSFFGGAPPGALFISIVCLGFALVARLIGLVGVVAIWQSRQFALLLTLLGLIGYFVAVHLFHGNSRYRIPVEPAMMLLVLFGLQAMWDWFRTRRPGKPAEDTSGR